MITYFKIAAAMIGLMLVFSLGFQLYLEYSGVLARAAYTPGLGFIGISHFGRVTYAGVSWYQDFQNRCGCRFELIRVGIYLEGEPMKQ